MKSFILNNTKFLLIVLFILTLSKVIHASGIGVCSDGGAGFYGFIGGNFVFDSNLSKYGVINYRLNIGADKLFFYGDLDSTKYGVRANLTNTLGLKLYGYKNVRVWIGPQLGLHYVNYEKLFTDDSYDTLISELGIIYPELILLKTPRYIKSIYGLINLGLILGVNINFNKPVTLIIDFGLRYGFGFKLLGSELSNEITNFEPIINIGLLYRIQGKNEYNIEEIFTPLQHRISAA